MTGAITSSWTLTFAFCAALLALVSLAFGDLDGTEDVVWVVILSTVLATGSVLARRGGRGA